MIKFIKNWTLPIAMIIGACGYSLFIHLNFLMPYLIFLMLLFTFCKVSFKDLHYESLHGWLLGIQLIGSIITFILLYPINKYVAESAMMCIIAPTASAAPVITGKLGGNIPSLTTYTLFSSILTSILVPLFFPVVAFLPPYVDIHITNNFLLSMFLILCRVFPIIILPLILAFLIRRFLPNLQRQMLKIKDAAFYLWGGALVIVMAVTVESLLDSRINGFVEFWVALAGLFTCIIQFYLGKRIGSHYRKRISGGQGLGQKNTILAIWISQTYLNPTASLGPCSYVIWQNIINSYQLWKKQKKDKNNSIQLKEKNL